MQCHSRLCCASAGQWATAVRDSRTGSRLTQTQMRTSQQTTFNIIMVRPFHFPGSFFVFVIPEQPPSALFGAALRCARDATASYLKLFNF